MASALVAAVYLILCSVLILSGRLIEGAETCTPDSGNPCRCNVAGGDSVDLTKLFQSGPLSAQAGGYTYHLDACKGVDCAGKCEDGTCVGCQTNDKNAAFGLASLKTAEYSLDGSAGSWVLTATYNKGQADRIMIVKFDYKQGTTSVKFDKEDPAKTYQLTVTGEYDVGNPTTAPATGKGSGVDPGIPGIVLIVLLLAAIVAYIVIGMIINATVRGTRGVEMIPNLNFWKDFPFLLKDGILFTFTCPCLRNSTPGYAKL